MQKPGASFSFALVCALAVTVCSYAQSTAAPMGGHPIQATNWSFQCFKGSGCGTDGAWITTNSQPGTVRLWDSGATWAWDNPSKGTYNWQYLDAWLDLIAEKQPRAVLYTFGDVPCWDAKTDCGNGGAENWSPHPPADLTSSGSATFNTFVLALVQHCTAAGHCVKDYIKYWELWNEPNLSKHWTGTANQLYQMVKPVVSIIRSHVSGAIVTTPAICGGDTAWMTSWMKLENANTRLSDYYSIHVYLNNHDPETRMKMVGSMINTKNANGWTKAPWLNTETNFNTTYSCVFAAAECDSTLLRWHILQYAYQGGAGGAFNVAWYDWNSISEGGYDTYYYTMMKWLVGASFTASCTSSGTVWSCPLTEASGKSALIVWNTAGNSNYKAAAQYGDYRSFDGTYGGAIHAISAGQTITINTFPIMLE
jgi:polysaccharide biosynthesis protein PslG